jgi:hypothetical protein
MAGFFSPVKCFCRSELARDDFNDDALNQQALVIVDDLREQARSYRPSTNW